MSTLSRWRERWRRRSIHQQGQPRQGQSLVELALMLPLISLIMVGTLDLGRIFYDYTRLTNAVKEGAFYANSNPGNEPAIKDRVKQENSLNIADGNITVTCYASVTATTSIACSTAPSGGVVQVRATYTFTPITAQIAGINPSGWKIGKTSRMVIE